MMCQLRRTDCNKHTTLVQDASGAGGCAHGGVWSERDSALSAQFRHESKTVLKNSLLKKNKSGNSEI